jgi:hypothetical protein
VNQILRVGRWLAKALVWLLAGLGLLVALWYAANRTLDPAIDPSLVSVERSPDAQNAAIAILGLTAPAGTDFVAYGAKIRELEEGDAPHQRILDALKGPRTLQPSVESEQANCWLVPDWPVARDCPPFAAAAGVVMANRELIDRLRKIFELERYDRSGAYLNQAFLVLVKLSVVDMQLDLRRGNQDAAYRKWRDQLRFVRTMVRGTDTWVGRAVGMVAMGLTLPAIESILNADPDVARRNASELRDLLRPGGVAAFGPEGIVRGEYAVLKQWLARAERPEDLAPDDRLHRLVERFGQKNRILNRYARFGSEYARAMQVPWQQLDNEYKQLREKHYEPSAQDLILDPIGSLFFADHIESQLKIREMIKQMHYLDGKLRLATLAVQQTNAEVPDSGMEEFLAAADPELRDPFIGRPMKWDPKDRKIYMTDPNEQCLVLAWFKLPAPRGASRPSGSAVNTNAC